MSDVLHYERADAVGTVTLHRPAAMNSLDTPLKVALRDALQEAAEDPNVRSVVLSGTGRAFCVGQDLVEHARNLEAGSDTVWSTVSQHYMPIVKLLATMPKPVVAAVNGAAAGAGAAFAFACDFRVAAQTATFTMAFSRIGLAADSGSSWTLQRLVGMAKAKELLLLSPTLSASDALELGLVTEVVAPQEVAARARELALRLAAGPTVAYGAIRRSVAFSAGHGLDESLQVEHQMMDLTGDTADHRDAVRAFLAKQEPRFFGR